jgi:hypothetical protein
MRKRSHRFALAATAAALLMASAATAADEPITSLGNAPSVTGSVGSDPNANACVNDQVDANVNDPEVATVDNQCATGSTPSANGTTGVGTRPTGTTGSTGSSTTKSKSSASAASVTAADAAGLKIAGIKPQTAGVGSTKRFRVLVTLRDLNGRLVRGGIVTLGGIPGHSSTIHCQDAAFTNKKGQARLLATVEKSQLGTRVLVRISARTPKARALQLRSVFLPRLR